MIQHPVVDGTQPASPQSGRLVGPPAAAVSWGGGQSTDCCITSVQSSGFASPPQRGSNPNGKGFSFSNLLTHVSDGWA